MRSTSLLRFRCSTQRPRSGTPKLAHFVRAMVTIIAPAPDEECEVPRRPPAAHPDLELAPCTTRDLPVLAAIHRRAFGPTAATRYLQANVEPGVFEEFCQIRFAKVLEDARAQNDDGSVVTVARRGDHMLGFAWSTREPAAQDRPPATNDKQERPIMAGADPVRTRELLGALEQHAKSIPFAHWSLHVISVDPAVQGTGVGKRLLRSVTEKAAEEGLPVTLEAMEEGLALYLSAGFEVSGDAVIAAEDSTVKLWPMMAESVKLRGAVLSLRHSMEKDA